MKNKSLVAYSEVPRKTEEVSRDDPAEVFKKLNCLRVICARERGIGLAAVQIGMTDRMFVVRNPDDSFRFFINTKYLPVGEQTFTSCESCLSIPGRMFLVPRKSEIRVVGTEVFVGSEVTFKDVDFTESDPLYSAVFQHEIDHCDGVMINEVGQEIRVRC
jgi:peptide deformylase